VVVNPAPTFTTQPASSIVCVGGTTNQMCVTYSNGTGTPSYQWYSSATNTTSGGTAITGATSSCYTPSAAIAGTTYYYAIISLAGGGCSSITSNTGEVIINSNTSLSTQPTPLQNICIGGSIPSPLSVTYSGGAGTPNYQWYSSPNNTAINGATSSSYTPPVFTTAGINAYYVVISLTGAGCGSQTSNIASINVVADPTATISQGTSYCQNAGNVASLSIAVSGGQGTTSYQWYSNTTGGNTSGTPITGANASTYTPPVNQTGATYYYCVVTQSGANCAVNSPASLITVTPAPTFTTQPIATQSVCVGGTTTQLNVAYSNGTGTATYQWYSNATNSYTGGAPVAGQTTSSFTPPSSSTSTIYYYCIISFAATGGCSMISSNIAEVVVLPDPTISVQPLTTQTICVGGTIPLALNVNYTGGVGTPTYQWFTTPSASISGATSNSFTPTVFNSPGTTNYYATISLSGSGCDALTSANAAVVVVADPTTTISSGATYCQNAASVNALTTVPSNGAGTNSYQWYSNTTGGNTSGSLITGATASSYTPPVNATGSTYYYCVVTQTGANCAVNSPVAQITVTPAPTFTTQPTPTQSVCVGGSTAQLNVAYSNGTGTATYQWYSNTTNTSAGGAPISGQTSSSYSPSSASSGTSYYYCIISFSAAGGCSMINSNIAEVVVLPDPTISVQPLTTQTICVGGTIPLALNVNYTGGVGTPTYQWFTAPSTSISGATSNSFTPTVFNSPGTTNYYATISLSGSGCDALTSANAAVIVIADPIVTVQPQVNQSVCQNTATSQLSVSITGGTGTASYQWYSNTTNANAGGTPIAGATLNTFTPPSVVAGTQYYYCTITQTGTNCGVTSNPAAVVVNLSPIFSNQPINTQQHCLNQSTNPLQVAYSNGTGTPTYQWYVNNNNSISGGTPINLATSNTYSPPSNIDGTFYYYCIVSFVSGGGCPSITSNISEVIIHPYPIVTITGGETICLLETSDINFAYTPASGLYDITYTANGQSVTIENYNGANPVFTVTPSQTTTYVVTNIAYDQVSQCAIQPNTSIVVIVNPLPALNNSTYTFCSDVISTSLQYTPDANSYTYNWLPNPSANFVGQGNGPSIINVTLPNPVGNSPTNFYYVSSLTNNATGCQALDSILVTINPNPVGSFTLPSTGCVDSPIALSNGDASIGNYEWTIDGVFYSSNPNPAPPVFTTLGIHTIEMVAINTYGCTDTLNSVIQIYDLPVSNFSTDVNNGCAPVAVNFTNLSSGQYVTSYDWTFAPDTVSWSNQYSSSNLINPPGVTYLQGDVTTIYTVTLAVTNACGTVNSQQNITVLPTPVANFTLATHTICSGSTLAVNNISTGEPTGYTWTYGNFTSYNPNLNSMFFPSDSVTHVYPITLTLTNSCGTDTYNDSITVLPDNVQGGFTTSLDAGCSPLTVTLTNTTFDTNLSATWHLDDPSNTVIANQNSIQFTYFAVNNTSQNYNPYLVVTDGCANDTIYSNISVFANPIPNISASQINICAGSSVDFSGNITGGGTGFDYAWDFGGLGTSSTQNSTFTFTNGSAQGLNIPVTLVVSSPTNNGTNCSNSVSSSIYVYNNPDLSAVSYSTTDGCSLLDVQVANLPANLNTINWGDGSINTNNFHTYTNNSGALLTYNLDVTSSITYPTLPNLVCTSITTEPITIHPSSLPVIASSATNSCEGQLVNFSASTSNNQNLGVSYSWNIGNLTSSNAVNTSFTFTTGSAAGTTYPIELTASQTTLGVTCIEIANATIVVYDTPDLTPLTFNTTSGCSNLNVVLSNLPAATNQINWGDGSINFANAHTYFNNGPGLLSYPVGVTSTSSYSTFPQLNCIASSNQIVNVFPTPLPQIFASAINVCEGDDIDFIASTANNQNTGITYLWDFGTMGTSSSANTTMTFDVGNATGLQTQVVLTAFQNTSGTICSAAVNDNVYVYDTPDLTTALYSDVNSCSPLLVSITNLPTSTYLYNWGDGTTTSNPNHLYLNQGTTPLTYNVTIDATSYYPTLPLLACNAIANQIVQVNPQPFAAFTFSSDESCLYNPVTTTLQNNSLNAIAPYVWNYDGIAHTTNSLNYIGTFNTAGAHPVELIVSNQFGCTDSVSHDFIIHELPTVTLNAIDDDLCNGTTAEFEIDGTGISTSSWDFGDGTTLNLLNPTSLIHYYSQPGVYSVTAIVTSIYGCSDTLSFPNEIIVHPSPTASFTTSATTADIVYPYFEFYDNSAGAINYYWNFGDSNWSNDINPTHTYNSEGDYLVELTVTNEYNCFDIATEVVHVEGIVMYVPNAFTPLDYNGVNDVFKPSFSSTDGIEFYEFTIYDRWGIKIFKTNDFNEPWIGNSQEHPPGDDNYYAQNDVYTYQVIYRKKARADDPQPDRIVTGHVTIIR
jgi:PKD repeat protein